MLVLLVCFTSHQLKGSPPTMLQLLQHDVRLLLLGFLEQPTREIADQVRLGGKRQQFRSAYRFSSVQSQKGCCQVLPSPT
jgi:hypothetical protein